MINNALDEKVWAVVGATNRKNKFGWKIYNRLVKVGYKVYPVNPGIDEIDGVKCYNSIEELPEVPSVVDVVVAEKFGVEVVKMAKKIGVKYVWLQPGADKPLVLQTAKELGVNVIQGCALIEAHNGPLNKEA
jgi:predicted CoA-binding protein